MNAYSGQSIQPLAPFLQSELHLKHFQIGMLSSVFFLGAFFLSIPMGWLVDRVGVYWTMAIGQLVVGSFILSISLAHSFSTVCGFLFLAGMGHAPINPATGKAVMSWFSIKGRATAMGVKQTGIPMGGVLAAATLPTIAIVLDWRKAFIISGAISLLSFLFCLLFYKKPQMEKTHKGIQPLSLSSLWEILKDRDLMLLSCLVIVFMALQISIQTYLVLFCKERLLFSVITAGYFLSFVHLGGVVGRLTWGPVSDFFFRGRRKIVLIMIGTLSFIICLSFTFLSPQFPIWFIVGLIFLFGYCAIGWNGVYLTLAAELAGRDRAGMATGVSLSIAWFGIFFGPPLFGYIVDQTQSYSYAWFIFSLMTGLATLFIGWVHEPIRHLTE
jgi:MFS family permease